jgi:ring-1,2-phenylacetyl-CoA epoxidase subunit PaaA
MGIQDSLGVSEQQYHNEYRAHTGAHNFDEPNNLPAEYRDLLVRMLSIQARIELEYMLVPERTLLRPMAKAPHPEDKVEYAAFWAEEVRHASYWWKILEGLGVKIDQQFMSTPLPIYLFEMRDLSEDWVEYAYFSFFGDRQGAYMGFEWVGCTYAPLAKISERVWREEIGHAAFGYTLLRRACQTPEGRKAAEHNLPKWYAAGLDMFGSDSSKRQYDYIKWGLRKRSNKQMRDAFIVEVNELLNKVGLPVPDAASGRKYL